MLQLFGEHLQDWLYWICGTKAYQLLLNKWTGACVLGTMRPSFFLLPPQQGEDLSYSVYDEGRKRVRRNVFIKISTVEKINTNIKKDIEIGSWKDNEWPPERIIKYYGPAT